MQKLREIMEAGLTLLFPPTCSCCRKMTGGNCQPLCRECFAQLKFVKSPYCSCCGRVFPGRGGNHLCGDCLKSSWAFDRARSLFAYEEIIARLIHDLKYSGKTTGIETIGWLSRQSAILDDFGNPDLILPVPLHLKRLRKRGFNQAQVLAKAIFPGDRKKIRIDLLTRQVDTLSQTTLSGKQRRENLKNAFLVKRPSEITGRNILILDDVFTTGSTVNECSQALKTAGCKRVEILTICRADKTLP